MPLPAPDARELLHARDIALRGYRRADGQLDIEAHLTDVKTASPWNDSGRREKPAGEPIHDMWIRMTVDESLHITACVAVSDHTPYAICPGAAPNFARLAGLRIGPGFNRAVVERVGGTLGCTHLREVLGQMATVAYQTIYPLRARKEAGENDRHMQPGAPVPRRLPPMVGSCIAYAPDSPVTLERWPWVKDVLAEKAQAAD
ncbi:MAG: DUF2889 domain-containing protein [Acetobacteraceae bacterium]|nr:DUF2889 domain-containing protein [Acetobacteraceae bacterium]